MSPSENGKRVLMIRYGLMAADLLAELESRGFSVRQMESKTLTVESFKAAVAETRPAFLLNVNYSPEIAFLCSMEGLPYVSWTIDPLPASRFKVYPKTRLERCLAFVHQKAMVEKLEGLGLPHVVHLPLAAPGDRRRPVEEEGKLDPYRCELSFVGVSLRGELETSQSLLRSWGSSEETLERVAAWMEELRAERADRCDFRGFTREPGAVPGWIRESLPGAADEAALADALDGWLSHLLRVRRIQALEPQGVVTWGDAWWGEVTEGYAGYADHGEQLTLIYNASAINLDMPRVYQRDILTMRTFDIMASGGLVVSEPSAELGDLFEDGKHLFTYRDTRELQELVARIREQPELGREVARRGHEEVLARHLLSHRVDAILAGMEARGLSARGGSSSRRTGRLKPRRSRR